MALVTTTIGSHPLPKGLNIANWFQAKDMDPEKATKKHTVFLENKNPETEKLIREGIREVVLDQVHAGIDIPTDGEVRREHYINYHCRHLDGIDFTKIERKVVRGGACELGVPVIYKKITPREHFLPDDYRIAQSFSDNPIKITVPGPTTIADTISDNYYNDERRLLEDLSCALNFEILALAKAGCTYIQIDEPVFARKPKEAISFGIENLERCFHGLPASVEKIVHICCGYPQYLDQKNYQKADPLAYFDLAHALEEADIDTVSLEDAHRHNDLSLLENFQKTKIILGVIAIAESRIETVEEIKKRLSEALNHIDKERLVVAPDCGLGMLDRETAKLKLSNMAQAVR